MNKIFCKIAEMINESISKYLPDVKSEDLEENGTIAELKAKYGL